MLPVFPYEVQVRTDLRTVKVEPLEACVASFYQIYHQFTDQKFIYKVHAQTTRNTLLTSQFAQLQLLFTGTRLRYTLLWDEISTALTDDCSHKVAVMSRIDALINWQARSFMAVLSDIKEEGLLFSSFKLLCFSWQNTTDKIWIY